MKPAFGTDWWPEGAASPRLRLAAAIALSPLICAAAVTGAAFLIYGANLPDRDTVMAATLNASFAALVGFSIISFTFGLAAVLVLWLRRLRSVSAFAIAGAVAGAAFAVASSLTGGGLPTYTQLAALTAVGAIMLMLVRAIGGVRAARPAPQQPAPQ